MNVVVVGMAARDVPAFDFFMKRTMGRWHWQAVPVQQDGVLPDADVLVVDLAAHGWAQRTAEAHHRLSTLVGDKPAVLLVSSQDRTWAESTEQPSRGHWIWLAKPYGAQRMEDALVLAGAKVAELKAQAKVTPEVKKSELSASPVNAAALTRPAMLLESQTMPTTVPQPLVNGLGVDELALKLQSAPEGKFILFRQLVKGLRASKPFELRFTVQNSLIVHPVEAWVATNTPKQVIARVGTSDAMAQAIALREMSSDEAYDRVQRLGMTLVDLDEFLHDIAAHSLA